MPTVPGINHWRSQRNDCREPLFFPKHEPRGGSGKGNRRMTRRKGTVGSGLAGLPKLGEAVAAAEFNNFSGSSAAKFLFEQHIDKQARTKSKEKEDKGRIFAPRSIFPHKTTDQ